MIKRASLTVQGESSEPSTMATGTQTLERQIGQRETGQAAHHLLGGLLEVLVIQVEADAVARELDRRGLCARAPTQTKAGQEGERPCARPARMREGKVRRVRGNANGKHKRPKRRAERAGKSARPLTQTSTRESVFVTLTSSLKYSKTLALVTLFRSMPSCVLGSDSCESRSSSEVHAMVSAGNQQHADPAARGKQKRGARETTGRTL